MLNNQTTINNINFIRINNDINGNPRYVFHYLELTNDYDAAVKIANKIGGRKYRAKWYGGGIVIQSYNLQETANLIKENKINN